MVTADLAGLSLRVRAVYQDANGVLEQVFSPQPRRSTTSSYRRPRRAQSAGRQ